jgi:hypothetical protein
LASRIPKIKIGDALLKHSREQVVGKFVLIGEARRWYGLKLGKKARVRFVAQHNGFERIICELIVVPVVAEGCGSFREVAQIGFILLFEKSILGGEAILNGLCILSDERCGHGNNEKYSLEGAHNRSSLPEE